MLIKHVTIQNVERTYEKRVSASEAFYSVHVYLSYVPDRVWKHYFYKQSRKVFSRMKRLKLTDNEIRFYLTKDEDIQSYIDCIKNMIWITDRIKGMQDKRTGLEAL